MIRKATKEDCGVLADIISESFREVARRFLLTKDNCPTHSSNCTTSWVESDMARGVAYFILSHREDPMGCVALECPSNDVCYMERLSVLPEMRGRHFGVRLVRHALAFAASKGVSKVSIGIISKHTELKDWYKALGFVEVESKWFAHLPFQVCFLEFPMKRAPYGPVPADGG